jgi:hypothetical protein
MQKRMLTPLTVLIALALSGIALAFSSGSGAGAGAGTAILGHGGGVFLHASVPPGIFPGGRVPVGITVSNPGTAAVELGTIHLADISVDPAHANCVRSDFSMPDIIENDQVPAGAVNYSQGGGTLFYADTDIDQSACKGATLTLTLSGS